MLPRCCEHTGVAHHISNAQDASFDDLLADHPIGVAATQSKVPLGFWRINDFYTQEDLASLQARSRELFDLHGVRLHKALTAKVGSTYYKTFAASKHPCSCMYSYAGFQAGKASSNYKFWNNDADADMARANELFRALMLPFQTRLGIPFEMCPDPVVRLVR